MSKVASINHKITITLDLTQVAQDAAGKGFDSEAAILAWVTACLNCNTNHVRASVSQADEPVLVVQMDGGLIHGLAANRDLRVIVLDEDLEGADDDDIAEIDGSEVYLSDRAPEVNPAYTQQIADEVDAL